MTTAKWLSQFNYPAAAGILLSDSLFHHAVAGHRWLERADGSQSKRFDFYGNLAVSDSWWDRGSRIQLFGAVLKLYCLRKQIGAGDAALADSDLLLWDVCRDVCLNDQARSSA